MTRKKIIASLLLILPLLGIGQDQRYTIQGRIKDVKNTGMAYISFSSWGKAILDSAQIQNGQFTINGSVPGPMFMSLYVDYSGKNFDQNNKPTDSKGLFIDGGTLQVEIKDSVKNAKVTGSAMHQEYEDFVVFVSGPDARIAAVNREWDGATEAQKKDIEYFKSIQKQFDVLVEEKKDLVEVYILKYPDSYFSLTGLRDMCQSIAPARFEKLFNHLSERHRNSDIGGMLVGFLADAKKTALGSIAPDFTQFDPEGKGVKLSDFRGQYVLLDFWASWCGPCRAENPHLVKAYAQFKGKNFTILGVSLDLPGQKKAWLDAVAKDNMTWPQVSDLKGWKNEASALYGIKGIPQNFLIDPQGKIVALNLRGDKLRLKLLEILGE